MTEPLNVAGRILLTPVAKFDPQQAWEAVTAVAVTQHAIIAAVQLLDLGIGRSTVTRWVRKGRLHRIHHGVYSLVPKALLTRDGHRMAAVLACGCGAALSRTDAGKLRRLIGWSRSDVWEVTVPGRGGRHRPGILVHRSSTLRPSDVEVVDGIPCTSVARTIFDLAEILTPRQTERMLDEAEGLEVYDQRAIDEQIAHNRGRSKAIGNLTTVLGAHRVGSTRTDGEVGERLLEIIRGIGLPDPRTQLPIDLGDGEPLITADFAYPDLTLILETDGSRHRTRRRIDSDKRRDQRAAAAGWQTLRFTWDDVTTERRRTATTVLAVTRSRRRSPPSTVAA